MKDFFQFQLTGACKQLVRGDAFIPELSSHPVVIVCHGFKGFKRHSFFPYLGENLSEAGYAVLNIDFSHNGVGDNGEEFDRLELFRENRFSYEEEDLQAVVSAVLGEQFPFSHYLDPSRIALVGHSRGGAAVLAVGAKRPLKIDAVVTLASISRISIPQPEDQAEWRRNGECFIHNSRTNQQMPLGVGLLDELIDRPNRIEESVRQLDLPLLIVHGDNDETVPLDAAEELSAWATHSSKVIIKGGSHTFGAKHPFTGPSNELQRVVQEIVAFLGKQFFD